MSPAFARARVPAALSIALALTASCATPRYHSSALATPGAGLRTPIMFGPEVAIRSRVCAPRAYVTLREYHTRRTVRESGGAFGTSRDDVEERSAEADIPSGAAVRNVTISIEAATERPATPSGHVSSASGAAGGAMVFAAGMGVLASVLASPTFRGTLDVRGEVVSVPTAGCAPVVAHPAQATR